MKKFFGPKGQHVASFYKTSTSLTLEIKIGGAKFRPNFTSTGLYKGNRLFLPVLKIAIKSSREIDRSFSYRKTLCF